jgi:phosphatidylinositol alpha-1,6-mannosyltransferase
MDFPPTRGGIQTMAREIVTRASRFSFTVVAPADPDSDDGSLPCRVVRARTMAPGRRGYVPGVAFAAARELARERYDVALSLHVLSAPGALLVRRAPLVVVCHGGELRSRRIRRVARRVLPRAARVVANSRFTRSEAIALGADPLRMTVIGVGAPDPVEVSASRVEAVRARAGGRFVLSVARLAAHKGHDRLIEALDAVPGARLVIVGDGPARAELEQRAARFGARVTFAGSVSDDELPAYYAAADAFALLSRATTGPGGGVEGGGIALLEACAYGLPVVAAATGGIPETILEGETGLLVNPDDGAAVARALRRVLEDRALAERLGANARALATGERSWANFVARLEDVLEAAAARAQGGAA